MSRPLVFLKLGGSLITDKTRPGKVRAEVLSRLAREIAGLAAGGGPALVVGHGSGSFGHPVAERHRLDRPVADTDQVAGVAATQDQAARLHRLVVAELLAAGARPFGWAPSTAVVARDGCPEMVEIGALTGALDLGLLPVVYGDVVVDRVRGASICSTERVFLALAGPLTARGWPVERIVWLGETAGVWDDAGRSLPCLDRRGAAALGGVVGGARGTDVTGGMAHRLEAALTLADRGIESWIVDGREPGRLAVAARGGPGPGTRICADCGTSGAGSGP